MPTSAVISSTLSPWAVSGPGFGLLGRSSQPTWSADPRTASGPTPTEPSSTSRKPLYDAGSSWATVAPGSSRMSVSVTGTWFRVGERSPPERPL